MRICITYVLTFVGRLGDVELRGNLRRDAAGRGAALADQISAAALTDQMQGLAGHGGRRDNVRD